MMSSKFLVYKTKLSKRQGDVAVEDYINNGYLKDALINFVSLLTE